MISFLLEVGTEELPASFVASALEQWRSLIPTSLQNQALQAETIQVFATPRRLAVLLQGLPERQADRLEEIKGPAAQAAFKDGKPTKAAEGFARSRNVALTDLEIRSTDKGDFVFVQQQIIGRSTADILTELISNWIFALEGKRFMRWGDGDLRFSRPIRWLVALMDDQVLPLTLDNGSGQISSDRISWGHRVLHSQPISLNHADAYVAALEAAYVLVDSDRRRETITTQVKQAADLVGGTAEIYSDLLAEVIDLVEWPTAVVGKFDPEFLSLPVEVITTVMVTHQRYFPVLKTAQELLPYFITISNGDPAQSQTIAEGNERVIRARLADGRFFYEADRALTLEAYLPRLETVTFQADLGSMAEKVKRLCANATLIVVQLLESRFWESATEDLSKIADSKIVAIQRAAELCKADLVTQMVGEFPELQGIMGEKYALSSGESEAVATAIVEHYLPKHAGDRLPQTLVGQVVGLADRLDTLVSIFGLGMIPTGSSDPFALRRAANAVLNIIWDAKLALNLVRLLEQIVTRFRESYPKAPAQKALEDQLESFFLQRLRSLLQEEQGIDYDLVNAVLGEDDPEYNQRALGDVLDTQERAKFLSDIRQDGTLATIYETVNRAARLARQGDLDTTVLDPATVINADLLKQPAEQDFHQALVQLLPQTQAAQQQRNYRQLVSAIAAIAPTVSRFFDGPDSVLVMDENLEIRQNRLNLLGLLRNHARLIADFGAIVKS